MTMELLSVTPLENKKLKLAFKDGSVGILDVCEYFDLIGVLEILSDENVFKKVRIKDNCLHWTDDCELSSETLYAIITNQKIYMDGKIVFDPELKKGAWDQKNYFKKLAGKI